MKSCYDLKLGESLCIFTFFLFSESGLHLLNGFDFYFEWRDTENQQYHLWLFWISTVFWHSKFKNRYPCWWKKGGKMAHCTYNWTTSYFQALPLTNFNLGQNKKEQLSPFPPKAMMKARRSKNTPLWHHWSRGRAGPDVSFTSFKIVGSISAALSTRVQHTSPNFLSQPEKKYETRKVRKGKGPSKRKAKRQEKFRNGQCRKKKKIGSCALLI